MDLAGLATQLTTEATQSNHRRLLVLAGPREQGYAAVKTVLEAIDVPMADTTLVGPDPRIPCERLPVRQTEAMLGRTRKALIYDAHEEFRPTAVGQLVGAVDGGGLMIHLVPALEDWPDRTDEFDAHLAVPPYDRTETGRQFKQRIIKTYRRHHGVAIVNLETQHIEDPGTVTSPPKPLGGQHVATPNAGAPRGDTAFPQEAYDRCVTGDQRRGLQALETLTEPSGVVVLTADRGRGKSSVCGLAAGSLARNSTTVTIVAPNKRNVTALFQRATELLTDLSRLDTAQEQPPDITTSTGGHIRFCTPATLPETCDGPVLVDEAAALPVRTLERVLAYDRVGFATTVHGYEGAGRGFSVRFMNQVTEHDPVVRELQTPVRYAAGDPLETWAFDALLLDARPVADQAVAKLTDQTVSYQRLTSTELCTNEALLREAFGLLVLAHYRTDPDDLARLLDAPNVAIRALVANGHILGIALLAREGGLPAARRSELYEGGRIQGHMLPDVLTSQLRDEQAAAPTGVRVLRIATHPACRSEGYGSQLLDALRSEATAGFPEWADRTKQIDWLGVGFGATPQLLSFWRLNDYRTVHFATTRNDRSGEHSALMLSPITEAGEALMQRLTQRFTRRIRAVGPTSLAGVDSDVFREVLRGVAFDALPALQLTDWEWEVVAGVAYGPGLVDVAPAPFARLLIRYLAETPAPVAKAHAPDWESVEGHEQLDASTEAILVARLLQGHSWERIRKDRKAPSVSTVKRTLGAAVVPLAEWYGPSQVATLKSRFTDG